jgi:hypothetical protein
MKCPRCGLEKSPESQLCGCGDIFSKVNKPPEAFVESSSAEVEITKPSEPLSESTPENKITLMSDAEKIKYLNSKANRMGIIVLITGIGIPFVSGITIPFFKSIVIICFLIGLGAVMERRGRSPWNALLYLAPCIGLIILIWLYCHPKPIKFHPKSYTYWWYIGIIVVVLVLAIMAGYIAELFLG